MVNPKFNNRGPGPLKVPGTDDVAHCYELPEQDRFTHGFGEWRQTPNITKKELLILHIVQAFTDRPTWLNDIFSREVVEEWKSHLFATEPLMSAAVLDWCLLELQDKAREFGRTGIVNVLDNGAVCCKSETLIDADLCRNLVNAISNLEPSKPRRSTTQVPGKHHIVNPNAYALRFDETPVLKLPHVVEIKDPFNAQGETYTLHALQYDEHSDSTHFRDHGLSGSYGWDCQNHFSDLYQWLPFELSFAADNSLVISSYVNGIHPLLSEDLQILIARCAGFSVHLWDRVVQTPGLFRGRCPPRIKSYGVEWWQLEHRFKDIFNLFRRGSKTRYNTENDRSDLQDWVHGVLASEATAPPDFSQCAIPDPSARETVYFDRYVEHPWSGVLPPAPVLSYTTNTRDMERALLRKWRSTRRWKYPEPGSSYSFSQWRTGGNLEPIIKSPADRRPDLIQEGIFSPSFGYPQVDLAKQFRHDGLQVHLEIIKFQLTPEQPCVDSTPFTFSGNLNEHIAATTIICFEMQNISPDAGLEFRHAVDTLGVLDENVCYDFHDLELQEVFDLPELNVQVGPSCDIVPSFQHRGSIKFRQGRSIAWPNTLQYRFLAVSLENPSTHGCLSVMLLHLVDPNYRICSTLNVRPMQPDWIAREQVYAARLPLPQELRNMVEADLYSTLEQNTSGQTAEAVASDKEYFQSRTEAYVGNYESGYVSTIG